MPLFRVVLPTTDGSKDIFMDNRYTCPELLVLMISKYDMHGVGIYKANRKGFASNKLPMDKQADRCTFTILVDKRLGMMTTRWENS